MLPAKGRGEGKGEIGKNKSRVDAKSLKTTAIMHFAGRVPLSVRCA